jgi:hypothetical protein
VASPWISAAKEKIRHGAGAHPEAGAVVLCLCVERKHRPWFNVN